MDPEDQEEEEIDERWEDLRKGNTEIEVILFKFSNLLFRLLLNYTSP